MTSVMTAAVLDGRLEQHRPDLRAHCQRMLGSSHDAEDAVQETLVRAWRGIDGFEGRSDLRGWLYRIATNVCLDHVRQRQRRPAPIDLVDTPPATLSAAPQGRTVSDPADRAVARESVRAAFGAALRHLSPRQRGVLILRDVLRWRATEVAQLLCTTEVSINSALQRARATLADECPRRTARGRSRADRRLLERYIDAFERFDIDALVGLAQQDATGPPRAFAWSV